MTDRRRAIRTFTDAVLRMRYGGPPMVVFCSALDKLADEMLASVSDVMFIPYSGTRAPTWISPPEPDYPVLVSDPGPLDADV